MKKALQLTQIPRHGMTAHREGRLAEAERSYQAVLDVKRDDFDSLPLLGVVRWQQRRHDEASQLIKQALRVRPDSAEAWASRNVEALASYDKARAAARTTSSPTSIAALCCATSPVTRRRWQASSARARYAREITRSATTAPNPLQLPRPSRQAPTHSAQLSRV